ncbi:MAG: hypothetical protein Q7U04_11300 [Bacteriovorax sp.]|nr:hypothetical protein [Bacteriovorax sp.]
MKTIPIILLIALSLLSCNKKVNKLLETHYQIDCQIFDFQFKAIKNFPGDYCTFLSNGEWISMTGPVIDLHSKTNQLRWHFPQTGFGEIKLSEDETKIIFLSTELRDYQGKKIRFDTVNLTDRNGVPLATWSLFEQLSSITQKIKRDANLLMADIGKIESIYEIPANALESKYSFLKKGNFLITLPSFGVVVIDSTFKKIEYIFELNRFGLREGQILSSGQLIIFTNDNAEEYDLAQNKLLRTLQFKIPSEEGSPSSGPVQLIFNNGYIVVTNTNAGGSFFELNHNGEVVKKFKNTLLDSRTKKSNSIYLAKKLNLAKFLENNF